MLAVVLLFIVFPSFFACPKKDQEMAPVLHTGPQNFCSAKVLSKSFK
jgi:hypothetical protein